MGELSEIWARIQDNMIELGNQILSYGGIVLLALLVWWLGKKFAKFIRRKVTVLLNKPAVVKITNQVELPQLLKQFGITEPVAEVLANLIYYIILAILLYNVFAILGFSMVNQLMTKFINFIPDIFVAILLLVLGSYLSNFVAAFLYKRLDNLNFSNARPLSNIARVAVLILVYTMILQKLQIDGDIISTLTKLLFAAIFLGLAIAFGYGGRDLAKKSLEDFFKPEDNKSTSKED